MRCGVSLCQVRAQSLALGGDFCSPLAGFFFLFCFFFRVQSCTEVFGMTLKGNHYRWTSHYFSINTADFKRVRLGSILILQVSVRFYTSLKNASSFFLFSTYSAQNVHGIWPL